MKINTNHNITTVSIKRVSLERLRHYAKYGDSLDNVVTTLMDEYDKFHQPKQRNSMGQFVKRSD